ncbi:hypothetical protein [Azospirillum sp. B506]|uniref:hypothetical protein n=1 Tax=Azospirillum sp. B506 TaxID=137721 RepID=UPI0005B28151|nr:hypothetical protein [Azospirillum sp. B506]
MIVITVAQDHLELKLVISANHTWWSQPPGACNNQRETVEGQIGRWKQGLGPALRFHTDEAQTTEVAIGVVVLNRMLDLGHRNSIRVS